MQNSKRRRVALALATCLAIVGAGSLWGLQVSAHTPVLTAVYPATIYEGQTLTDVPLVTVAAGEHEITGYNDLFLGTTTMHTATQGLTLNTTTGTVSGTVGYELDQAYHARQIFYLHVRDANGDVTQTQINWVIVDPTPTPDAIADRTDAEGAAVDFTFEVHDADNHDIPVVSVSPLPDGITLTEVTSSAGYYQGRLSGTVSSNAAQNANSGTPGVYSVTVSAHDEHRTGTTTFDWTITDSSAVSFTGAARNTSQTIDEGSTPTALAVNNADGDPLTFSVTSGSLPEGLALDSATGAFTGTASYTSHGSYTLGISVSDKTSSDTTSLSLTVDDADGPPAFSGAATNTAQTVSEGVAAGDVEWLAPLEALDPDGGAVTFAMSGGSLPPGVAFDAGAGAFTGTVDFATGHDERTYTADFQVTDAGGQSGSTELVITVSDVNRPPVWEPPDAQDYITIDATEGQPCSDPAYDHVTDPDGDTVTFDPYPNMGGLSLLADGTWSGTANWDANHITNGAGFPTRAHDGHDGVTGNQYLMIMITDVNRAPVFGSEETNTAQTVAEGATAGDAGWLAGLTAHDPEGDGIGFSVTAGSLPPGVSLNTDGTFSGTVNYQDDHLQKTYTATIRARDDYSGDRAASTVDLTITVTDVNQAPSFTAGSLDFTGTEGQAVAGGTAVTATDPESDTFTYSASAGSLPPGVSLNSDGTVTGTPDWDANHVSEIYSGTVTVEDEKGATATAPITFSVTDVNRDPAYSGADTNTAQSVAEGIAAGAGSWLTGLEVSDDESDALTFTVTGGELPPGISLVASGTEAGTFTGTAEFATGHDDRGYTATITVSDGNGGSASTGLTITVTDVNRAPAIPTDQTQSVAEGTGAGEAGWLAALDSTDPDGDTVTYTVVAGTGSLPPGVTLNADGSFSGEATPQPDHSSPTYTVTGNAIDGHTGAIGFTISITVTDVNQAPAYTGAATNTAQSIPEGTDASDAVSGLAALAATDFEGDTLTYSLTAGELPPGLALVESGPGAGSFTGTAEFAAGHADRPYTATITVSDGNGGTDTTGLTIAVTDVNRAPAFGTEATNTAQAIDELAPLAALTVSDPDGDALTFTLVSGSLPPGTSLVASGATAGSFSGNASGQSVGSYTAAIQVSDGAGGLTDQTTLTVTVSEVTAPVFTADEVNTAQTLYVDKCPEALVATDADSDPLVFSMTGGELPAGVTFSADGTFSGRATKIGSWTATFSVTDGLLSGETTLTITTKSRPHEETGEETGPLVGPVLRTGVRISLRIGSLRASIDGTGIDLDAAPFITSTGRTMVPVRFIAEALGAQVSWNPETRQVFIYGETTKIVLTVGSSVALVNDERVPLDAPVTITAEGRTFVPYRFICEALGAQVSWDPATRTVTVTR